VDWLVCSAVISAIPNTVPGMLYDAKIKNATNDKTKKQTNELCSNNVKPSNQQNNNNTINNTTTINNNNKIRVRVTMIKIKKKFSCTAAASCVV
jgi:hypothetical protein